MLSQTVEYALRAVSYLASENDRYAKTYEIAKHTCVPSAYLVKVLQELVAGKIVETKKGIGGGVKLSRSPEKITILEVVNAVEPIIRIKRCPLGLERHGRQLCPLHRRLDAALASMEKAFQETTLAEVLDKPAFPHTLCDITHE